MRKARSMRFFYVCEVSANLSMFLIEALVARVNDSRYLLLLSCF